MSTTGNTPGQTGNGTPVLTDNRGTQSLVYSSVEASTGQVEIKNITPDQREAKGLVTDQNDVKTFDQGSIQSLSLDQKDTKAFVHDQRKVKDPAADQKEGCCDDISGCVGHDHQNMVNTPTVVKSENKKVDVILDDDDDDDFKPPKKKYRAVGVC